MTPKKKAPPKSAAPPPTARKRGAAAKKGTRERIYDAALGLLRKHGYAATTMRDVAAEAGVALGAAYYYFPSKDAIVQAYYEAEQLAHEERARATLATEADLRKRLSAVLHGRLELARRDRKLAGALFHAAADPDSPVSVFAKETAKLREASMTLFEEALSPAIPEDVRPLAARAFWALLMGLLLYLVHDDSPRAERTMRLAESGLDLAMNALALLGTPFGAPIRAEVERVLRDAKLL